MKPRHAAALALALILLALVVLSFWLRAAH
jgi:hypothetical protein